MLPGMADITQDNNVVKKVNASIYLVIRGTECAESS
jgi:hypothetical protein